MTSLPSSRCFFAFVVCVAAMSPAAFAQQTFSSTDCSNPPGGYEGFGSSTTGGSGQSVYVVDTLADSGTGSLRDALSRGDRCIVFDVGGTIDLQNTLKVRGANVTIDGFTAPSPGITLQGSSLALQGAAGARNVVVRGIRHRGAPSGVDAFYVYQSSNVVFDHISVSQFGDGAVDVTEDSSDVTIQWSILGDGIETHNLATLVKYGTSRVSVHHNLYMGYGRNPFCGYYENGAISPELVCDVRNNLIWDYRWYGTEVRQGGTANVVNNYYYTSYESTQGVYIAEGGQAFTSGNVSHNGHEYNVGNVASPYSAASIESSDALTAAQEVVAFAGARGPNFDLDSQDVAYLAVIDIGPADQSARPRPPQLLSVN